MEALAGGCVIVSWSRGLWYGTVCTSRSPKLKWLRRRRVSFSATSSFSGAASGVAVSVGGAASPPSSSCALLASAAAACLSVHPRVIISLLQCVASGRRRGLPTLLQLRPPRFSCCSLLPTRVSTLYDL